MKTKQAAQRAVSVIPLGLCCASLLVSPVLAAQELSFDSPFTAAPNTATSVEADQELQLTGIANIAGKSCVCIKEATKKGRWIEVGTSEAGIEVLSCDLEKSQAEVRTKGTNRLLVLKKPSLKNGVPTPLSHTARNPQRGPQDLASRGLVEQQPPLPPPPLLPASSDDAPADIGPAGGKLPPIVPLTSKEEEEREARMLVSDLMEIGMRQRKAYEEQKRLEKAKKGKATKP